MEYFDYVFFSTVRSWNLVHICYNNFLLKVFILIRILWCPMHPCFFILIFSCVFEPHIVVILILFQIDVSESTCYTTMFNSTEIPLTSQSPENCQAST